MKSKGERLGEQKGKASSGIHTSQAMQNTRSVNCQDEIGKIT